MGITQSPRDRVLTDDVERLRHSLETSAGTVSFSAELPRATAEKLLTLLSEERKTGAVVIPARNEFRTTEAAAVLGISRPHLSRLINAGAITARRVGNHWRISAEAIVEFQEAEAQSQRVRMDELTELENDAGFND